MNLTPLLPVLVASSLWMAAPAHAKTPQEIFAAVSPSVVVIDVSDADGKPQGNASGVVIAPGEVITNCHVASAGRTLRIKLGDARYPGTLHYADYDHDLCQLSVPDLAAPPVVLGDANSLIPGERVVAIGAPEGLELSISEGLISALRDYGDGSKVIQTTASISPGSSGGGLFDEAGRLIGLTTFFLKEGQNLNFALPVNWIATLSTHPVAPAQAKKANLDWFAHALALEQHKDWLVLLEHDRRWTQAEPKDPSAWYSLGYAYANLGQHAQASAAYRETLRIDPNNPAAWFNLGNSYFATRQYAEAIAADREALRINPKDANAWNNLGTAHFESHQYPEAITAEREALRIDPSFAQAWSNLGNAYDSSGQGAQSIAAYREALRIDPNFFDAWFNLGNAYGHAGRMAESIDAYRQALRINAKIPDVWLNLGLAYAAQGNRSSVIEVYQTLRKLDPAKADKLFDAAIVPH
jgi:tetratricopeptide (TPR) repeat protein